MGGLKGETWHWTSNIMIVHQGNQDHCGGEIKVEAFAAIPETDNKL